MNTISSPQLSRNYGFWNEAEQQKLLDSRVAIAGVGGDGFQLGLKLAQMGVSKFTIADPEVFEPENTNRVLGATVKAYGRKKVDIFVERVKEINPNAEIRVYDQGINEDNIEEFMNDADLVLDESELNYLHIGTMIAREARKRGIPELLVMNVGFAAQAISFKADSKQTFESVMGIPKNATLDEIKNLNVDFSRCLPTLPRYGDMNTLLEVQKGASLPSISAGVDAACALGSTQAFLHLVRGVNNHRPEPVWAPHFAYMDAYDLSAGVVRAPRLKYRRHGLEMAIKTKLGLNPKSSYTASERSKRQRAYRKQKA